MGPSSSRRGVRRRCRTSDSGSVALRTPGRAWLHYLSDEDDPCAVVDTLMEALAPGSMPVVSHAAADLRMEAVWETVEVYRRSATPLYPRGLDEVRGSFPGPTPMDPGVVPVSSRRPTGRARSRSHRMWVYAGVGRKQSPGAVIAPSAVAGRNVRCGTLQPGGPSTSGGCTPRARRAVTPVPARRPRPGSRSWRRLRIACRSGERAGARRGFDSRGPRRPQSDVTLRGCDLHLVRGGESGIHDSWELFGYRIAQ